MYNSSKRAGFAWCSFYLQFRLRHEVSRPGPGRRSTRTSGGVVRYQETVCQPLVVLKRQGDQESVPRTLA
ncbi:hypothetical protein DPMN_122943 [Dreissena polymorpha]|uniref:Uncharacterized protein n=1 Tax=Dreissena polymorpha TaxID=45954 RepID=A0A9D4JUX1_DREPO|nr:hypothetical protein DPMN_122943 [Dreissena polymorpha]